MSLLTHRNNTSRIAGFTLWFFVISTIVLLLLSLSLPAFAGDEQKDQETISNANLVLQDMLNSNSISPVVLSKANCILIIPDMKKFGFGVGGSGGRGPLLCR